MSLDRSRSLRRRMSPPEAMLWNALRREPVAQFHFRRQVEIGPYYADFASHRLMLVIEVDGASHFEDRAMACDARRDALIAAKGFHVLRVTTTDVFNRLDAVIAAVLAHAPADDL